MTNLDRIRELVSHAANLKIEMYEDTYLDTADSAVRFTVDVDRPNFGIKADLGNLRLHQPVKRWIL